MKIQPHNTFCIAIGAVLAAIFLVACGVDQDKSAPVTSLARAQEVATRQP